MRVHSSGIILPSAGFVCLFSEMLCGLSATQNRSCNPIYGLKPEEHAGNLVQGCVSSGNRLLLVVKACLEMMRSFGKR